ncbi:MAG: GH1 family beta-glucosidase [Rhodobacteraceae bacterium]|nr:GH1 family beta-glucosidase [Paracoccaceae bacterium]
MTNRKGFPDGFLFGAATSAYQIEGHAYGGAGPTLWDSFAAKPGKVVNGETGAIACDHYHRFEQDLDLLKGFDAYRFSTSWARVLPDGKGPINQQGLDFYDRLVDAILARGLQPHLTLYHWDMPAALDDLGGWTNPDVVNWFGDYCDIIMGRIGDRMASVATLNEPWCVTYLSYFLGHHAPGLRDIFATTKSVHNVLKAHGEALARLRSHGQKNLGIVLNFEALKPASQSGADLNATRCYDAIMNRMFVQPVFSGTYPEPVLDAFAPHLPANWQDDMAMISAPIDWLGVNYYTCKTVVAEPATPWPHLGFISSDQPKTQMEWDICPEGLFEILHWLQQEFAGAMPVFITENGIALADTIKDGIIEDQTRVCFINTHLQQVQKAIDHGINVKGYFYWSLLDNFEWAFGYEKRFGLIHVDFETQKRTPKSSFYHLQSLATGAKNTG